MCEWASACCHSAETDTSTWENSLWHLQPPESCWELRIVKKHIFAQTADVHIHTNQVWQDHRYVLYAIKHFKTLLLNTHMQWVLECCTLLCCKNVCVFWILLCDLQSQIGHVMHFLQRERETSNYKTPEYNVPLSPVSGTMPGMCEVCNAIIVHDWDIIDTCPRPSVFLSLWVNISYLFFSFIFYLHII